MLEGRSFGKPRDEGSRDREVVAAIKRKTKRKKRKEKKKLSLKVVVQGVG